MTIDQQTTEQVVTQQQTQKRPSSGAIYPLWLLSILLLAGVAAASYVGYQKFLLISVQNKELQVKVGGLSNHITALQQEQQEQRKHAAKLQQSDRNYHEVNALLLAAQLTAAADVVLKRDNDSAKAQSFLDLAVFYVAELPRLSPIRQALESDIAAIKGTPSFDQGKVIKRLSELSQQISTLEQAFSFTASGTVVVSPKEEQKVWVWLCPADVSLDKDSNVTCKPATAIAPVPAIFREHDIGTASVHHTTSWECSRVVSFAGEQRPQLLSPLCQPIEKEKSYFAPTNILEILRYIGNSLRNAVVISHKENLPLVLTAPQLVNLKLNLQSLLLEAVWAVQHQQPEVYKQALQETDELLHTYFSTNEKAKGGILPELESLLQINIATPTSYSLAGTLQFINNALWQNAAGGYNSANGRESAARDNSNVVDTSKHEKLDEKVKATVAKTFSL